MRTHAFDSLDVLDAMLAEHETLANVEQSIATVRALGLDPRPDILRVEAGLQRIAADQIELLALIGRRLSLIEAQP